MIKRNKKTIIKVNTKKMVKEIAHILCLIIHALI